MRRSLLAFVLAILGAITPALAKHHHDRDDAAPGLANVTLLIVRHAEKPAEDGDPGLSPAGRARAEAYAGYFQKFTLDGAPVHIDTLIATEDSDESARPRLTLEPLSKATGITIQHPFANREVKDAARWIEDGQTHQAALIAWHHGKIPKLLNALGADPDELLPNGEWPDNVFDWVIVLRYDSDGRLSDAKRIVEPATLVK